MLKTNIAPLLARSSPLVLHLSAVLRTVYHHPMVEILFQRQLLDLKPKIPPEPVGSVRQLARQLPWRPYSFQNQKAMM
jgi:hypothetical protein